MKKRYALYQMVSEQELLYQKQLLGYCDELPKERQKLTYRNEEGKKEYLENIIKIHTLSHKEYSIVTQTNEYRMERN